MIKERLLCDGFLMSIVAVILLIRLMLSTWDRSLTASSVRRNCCERHAGLWQTLISILLQALRLLARGKIVCSRSTHSSEKAMTEMSRVRREELEQKEREAGFDGGIMLPWDDLRALLRDSAWRERVERQVIERTADMPEWADGWAKDEWNYCEWVEYGGLDDVERDYRAPNLKPEEGGPVFFAIVDTGDEEGEG